MTNPDFTKAVSQEIQKIGDRLVHTLEKPCPKCRYLVKGAERDADALWCDPRDKGCGHFHTGECPTVWQDCWRCKGNGTLGRWPEGAPLICRLCAGSGKRPVKPPEGAA